MPARKKTRVVLCATLSADGKLDERAFDLPLILLTGGRSSGRHPWAIHFDRASTVMVDEAVGAELAQRGVPVRPALWSARNAFTREARKLRFLHLTALWTKVAVPPSVVTVPAPKAVEELARMRLAMVDEAVWCFGGGEWCRTVLETGKVSELCLCVRPRIDGRRGMGTLSGVGGEFFPASVACRLVKMEVVGDDCFLHYRVRQSAATAHKAS